MEEEFLRTTDTLWENEVQANLFVARLLIYTSGIAVIFLLLNVFGVFTVSQEIMFSIMIQTII